MLRGCLNHPVAPLLSLLAPLFRPFFSPVRGVPDTAILRRKPLRSYDCCTALRHRAGRKEVSSPVIWGKTGGRALGDDCADGGRTGAGQAYAVELDGYNSSDARLTGGWMAGARPARHSCCAALGRGCMIGPVGLVSERHEKACSTPMGEMAVVGAPDDFAGRILRPSRSNRRRSPKTPYPQARPSSSQPRLPDRPPRSTGFARRFSE